MLSIISQIKLDSFGLKFFWWPSGDWDWFIRIDLSLDRIQTDRHRFSIGYFIKKDVGFRDILNSCTLARFWIEIRSEPIQIFPNHSGICIRTKQFHSDLIRMKFSIFSILFNPCVNSKFNRFYSLAPNPNKFEINLKKNFNSCFLYLN